MTKPRWMRKRSSLSSRLDYIGRQARHNGSIQFATKDRTQYLIKFENDETWLKFMLSAYNIISTSYKAIIDKTIDEKTKKYILYEKEDVILIDIFVQIKKIWDEEGEPVTIAPENVRWAK